VFDDPARDACKSPIAWSPARADAGDTVATSARGRYFAVRIARAVPKGEVIATDLEPDMIRFMTERAKREA